MDITHLHLHVRDRARSEAFYARWLGLSRAWSADDITFMAGDREFLLALSEDASPDPLPQGMHFGARLPAAGRARGLLGRGAAGADAGGRRADRQAALRRPHRDQLSLRRPGRLSDRALRGAGSRRRF